MLDEPLNEWFAKGAVLANLLGQVFIRWPHGNRSKEVKVVEDRKGALEIGLVVGAVLGSVLLPALWAAIGLFGFAEYRLLPAPFVLGVFAMLVGLWLFHRSHVDLGRNWSATLQIREEHRLVTNGVYARIRHPMYSSLFLLGTAQALFLPNWIVGPSYLVGFGLLYLLRVGREEQMMIDSFGEEYAEYSRRTGRLFPK